MRPICFFMILFALPIHGDRLTPGQQAAVRDSPKPEIHSRISIVDVGGRTISLEDGSNWLVAPKHRSTVQGWIANSDEVIVTKGNGVNYPYTMKKLQDSKGIRVKPLNS